MQMLQKHEVSLIQADDKNAELSECVWGAAALSLGQCKSEGTGFLFVYWARASLGEPGLL